MELEFGVKSWSLTPFPTGMSGVEGGGGTCLKESFDCHITLLLSKYRERRERRRIRRP
jgi:hypothetical protein